MHFEFSYLGLYINYVIFRALIKIVNILKITPKQYINVMWLQSKFQ